MGNFTDRVLKLHCRQKCNGRVKPDIYLKPDNFNALFSEIQRMTCPHTSSPFVVQDFWLKEIMPKFANGNGLRFLGYNISTLRIG